ncbi:MAG: hypothetical protein D5R97_00580 [Candidatus Syntrophonatronum acetioxidans]|uniref:Uncharacterized protein n=1 Tax=Candidatus Syntrophonatronum acetioxidans TaxID=1795816 RepID=A0A424YIT4_9FIRM|nr:MAG: hypothetical protein D5R97_00580 [Candidatus Syntrophonatronum acetioxidans]
MKSPWHDQDSALQKGYEERRGCFQIKKILLCPFCSGKGGDILFPPGGINLNRVIIYKDMLKS